VPTRKYFHRRKTEVRNGGDDETRTRDLCRDSFNDIKEHGRQCKSLEVHHRQRYCVSRCVSRRPPEVMSGQALIYLSVDVAKVLRIGTPRTQILAPGCRRNSRNTMYPPRHVGLISEVRLGCYSAQRISSSSDSQPRPSSPYFCAEYRRNDAIGQGKTTRNCFPRQTLLLCPLPNGLRGIPGKVTQQLVRPIIFLVRRRCQLFIYGRNEQLCGGFYILLGQSGQLIDEVSMVEPAYARCVGPIESYQLGSGRHHSICMAIQCRMD
jgi:hypothetical protein